MARGRLVFSVDVLSLDPPAQSAIFGQPLPLRGFLRGIGGVVLQEQTPTGGWRQVGRVRTHGDGRFEEAVRPRFMRLAARFYVRGGIFTTVVAEHRKSGWKPGRSVELSALPVSSSIR